MKVQNILSKMDELGIKYEVQEPEQRGNLVFGTYLIDTTGVPPEDLIEFYRYAYGEDDERG